MATDWATLRRMANDQADLLTRHQCIEAGMPGEMLRWRVASGRWVRLHRGSAGGTTWSTEAAYPWRTSIPVTVLDVAAEGPVLDALSVVSRAVHRELVSVGELRQELRARGRHRHGRLLADVLGDVEDGAQSGAEVLYVRDVEQAHGLPAASRQSESDHGRRRYHDNEYSEYGLVVEVDGRLGHEHGSDRVRDGQRDRRLLGTAKATARVFWADVAITPCRTALELATILRSRGWTGQPRACRRTACQLRRLP